MEKDIFTIVITSTALATVFTTLIKYVIDLYISPSVFGKRSADEIVEKLRPQLIEAAEAADSYIRLMLRFRSRKWYSDSNDYFRMSVLYSIGQFFALHHIATTLAHPHIVKSTAIASDFEKYSKRAMKSLSGYAYQKNLSSEEKSKFENQEIPRRAIQAMAELMISDATENNLPSCITFVSFTNKIYEDKDFQRWFSYIDKAFIDIENRKRENLYFERFVLFSIGLRVFVRKLHPQRSNRIGRKLILYHINDIDQRSASNLRGELEEAYISYEYPFQKAVGDRKISYSPPSAWKRFAHKFRPNLRKKVKNFD